MNAIDSPASASREKSIARIFFWPLIIGAISAAGLVGALLEDGLWDVLFCALLAVPVVVGVVFGWRRR